MRDFELERKLRASMDDGANIWVIGDVHGYFSTLQSLVEKLELNENDAVVMLGDLIDRGPSSADVVNYVKSTENIHSIRGNHEQMMIEGFDDVCRGGLPVSRSTLVSGTSGTGEGQMLKIRTHLAHEHGVDPSVVIRLLAWWRHWRLLFKRFISE